MGSRRSSQSIQTKRSMSRISQPGGNESYARPAISTMSIKSLRPLGSVESTSGHLQYIAHPTSYCETLVHLFKGNIGSGIFAMGDAFMNAGLFLGTILALLIAFMCLHCQHILLNASTELKRYTQRDIAPDYAETVELCIEYSLYPWMHRYSKLFRHFVNAMLCFTQFGFCSVYFVFISSNLKRVCDSYGVVMNVQIWMLIILPPILLSCMIRNLKFLTPFSLLANVLIIIGIISTFYFTAQNLPSTSSRPAVAHLSRLPLFFGTTMYAFEGVALVLPLKNEMKKPKQFDSLCGVMNVGMVCVAGLVASIGFFSYLQYGNEIGGSVTLNFPSDSKLAHAIQVCIALSVLLSFALQFYIPIDIVWPTIEERYGPFKYPISSLLAFRAFFVIVTFVIAELIPALELLISLIGAMCSAMLALTIPAVLELAIGDPESKVRVFAMIKDWLLITFSMIGFLSGSYVSIEAIVLKFTGNED